MKHDELRCDFGIRMAGLTGLDHGKKKQREEDLRHTEAFFDRAGS